MKKKLLALGMVCALSLGTLGMSGVASAHYRHHHRHHHSSMIIHDENVTVELGTHHRHHRHHHYHHHHHNW